MIGHEGGFLMITRKEALEIALKHLSEQFKQFIDEAKEGSF